MDSDAGWRESAGEGAWPESAAGTAATMAMAIARSRGPDRRRIRRGPAGSQYGCGVGRPVIERQPLAIARTASSEGADQCDRTADRPDASADEWRAEPTLGHRSRGSDRRRKVGGDPPERQASGATRPGERRGRRAGCHGRRRPAGADGGRGRPSPAPSRRGVTGRRRGRGRGRRAAPGRQLADDRARLDAPILVLVARAIELERPHVPRRAGDVRRRHRGAPPRGRVPVGATGRGGRPTRGARPGRVERKRTRKSAVLLPFDGAGVGRAR